MVGGSENEMHIAVVLARGREREGDRGGGRHSLAASGVSEEDGNGARDGVVSLDAVRRR